MTLYEMGVVFNALTDALECAETDEARDAVLSEMDALSDSVSEKATAYAKIKQNLEAEMDALKAEAKRLSDMAKAKEKAVDRLKQRMMDAMVMTDTRKIQTDIGAWSIRKNPPKCVILDANAIPEEYLIPQEPKVDSRAILNAYRENGEIVEGVDIVTVESVQFR